MGAKDAVLIAIVSVAWAGNFFFSKLALRELPPLTYTALRLGLLGIVLGAFLERPPKGQRVRLVAVAVSMGVLHFGLAFWALRLSTTLAAPTLLLQSYVPLASLLAWRVLGEPLPPRKAAAIVFSFLGVLVLGFDPAALAAPVTLALIVVSALFLALGTVLMRGLTGLSPIGQQGWTAVIGFAPLVVWSLTVEPEGLSAVRTASWVAWGGVVYAALVVSLVGHGLFYVLLKRHPVAQVTPYLLTSPVLTVLLGVAFLGDRPGTRMLLGGAMVLAGVLALSLIPATTARAT
jgi:O-acetylserine/cysteine efflux transporter